MKKHFCLDSLNNFLFKTEFKDGENPFSDSNICVPEGFYISEIKLSIRKSTFLNCIRIALSNKKDITLLKIAGGGYIKVSKSDDSDTFTRINIVPVILTREDDNLVLVVEVNDPNQKIGIVFSEFLPYPLVDFLTEFN